MNTTDEIIQNFAGWAGPVIAGMATHTERVARTLTQPQSRDAKGRLDPRLAEYQRLDREGKAKMLVSLESISADRQRRARLAMDLTDLIRDAERRLARWLNTRRDDADMRRAELPVSPEVIGRAQGMAGIDPEKLLAEADRLLREGQPEEADVRLRAALMGGRLRSTAPGSSYGAARRHVDEALDRAVPDRAAIASRAAEAPREYERALGRVTAYRAAADALLTADPEDPSEAVARARQLAGTAERAA